MNKFYKLTAGIFFALFCSISHAEEYKELPIDFYPSWGSMEIASDTKLAPSVQVIQLRPGEDKDSDHSKGELLLYLQGLRKIGEKKNQAMLEMTSMIALAKTLEPKECSGPLFETSEELVKGIPHLYAKFADHCDGRLFAIGALLATQVNGKIIVIIRRLILNDFDGESVEETYGNLVVVNKNGKLQEELRKSQDYLRTIGKE